MRVAGEPFGSYERCYHTGDSEVSQLTWLMAMIALFVMIVSVSFDYRRKIIVGVPALISTTTDHVGHIVPQNERALQKTPHRKMRHYESVPRQRNTSRTI